MASHLDEVLNRIKSLMGERTLRAAAEQWGVGSSSLSSMLKDKRWPHISTIEKIAEVENVSVDWLLTGVGDDLIVVPCISGNIHPTFGDKEKIGNLQVSRAWANGLGLDPKNLLAMYAKGDSMAPTIAENAPIIIDAAQDKYIRPGLYVFRSGNELSVKRFMGNPITGELSIISDNPIYPPMHLNAEQVESLVIIGQVRMVMQSF